MNKNMYIILLLFVTFFTSNLLAETKRLVLVSGQSSDMSTLSAKELKKAFLGLTVRKSGNILTPIRNHSETIVHEVFLQNVIYMSSRNYERQLNSRTFRSGKKRILEFSSLNEVIDNLNNHNNSISYIWEEDAKKTNKLKIIQNLWEGEVD